MVADALQLHQEPEGRAAQARLRRCREDLADPRHAHGTISEIAQRWGYRSPAHFTRTFAARFGLDPRDFREAQRTAGTGPGGAGRR